ncbi:hypothetical protein CLAVI_000513 [Candidatus Clavichlamydia salmonicola]|uniref:hypothetical protein n=1 Tax=Candidatus Clavichlamydia salmonicola TaxID=469812 RepID=UPI001891BD80|nr:hypothetical protein [Candidatus Clavichlamydia salmonicola]MBF5050891.1 hypothetical protein [Candidatus Clavichlamydia salmonicola]
MASASVSISVESNITNLVLPKKSTERFRSSVPKCMKLASKITIVTAVIFLFFMTILAMTSMFISNVGCKSIMMSLMIASGVATLISLSCFMIIQSLVNSKKIQNSMKRNSIIISDDHPDSFVVKSDAILNKANNLVVTEE